MIVWILENGRLYTEWQKLDGIEFRLEVPLDVLIGKTVTFKKLPDDLQIPAA